MANRVTQISPGDASRSQRPANGSAAPPASGPSGTQSPDTRCQPTTSAPSNQTMVRRPRRTSSDRSGRGVEGGGGVRNVPGSEIEPDDGDGRDQAAGAAGGLGRGHAAREARAISLSSWKNTMLTATNPV